MDSFNETVEMDQVIDSYMVSMHEACPGDAAHSWRVSYLCQQVGSAMCLNRTEISELTIAGELHDIGKISVGKDILNKVEKLTDNEWDRIKEHPATGYHILRNSDSLHLIAENVFSHHERWDGKGYPRGLKGEEIDWRARVISVVDAYDAMTSDRPYRSALSTEVAAEEIRNGAGSQFDPDIARVFVEDVLKANWPEVS